MTMKQTMLNNSWSWSKSIHI